jgi:hypothetical protein
LYIGDVVAAPRYPVVVPWESGSSGRSRRRSVDGRISR